jgi:hypothetical protein
MIPLPIVEYNSAEAENNPVKRCEISKVQHRLGKVLTGGAPHNLSYDDMLKDCKIEVV